ncbi:hypothetical protein B0T21DRAFT_380267 [Apiosordaria backusii]|uniref:Uncharacterized protein n=1 Tax=Apiosordaria backusii TaxID=314023 RepID=A0AA40K7P3_9PEZI|nr:hypothetical protein B0T21DRAFT_380267 [Apiosordaria backusii]
MAELAANPGFPVLALSGVTNGQGYCSLNLAEVVPGCGTIDIELNGGSFRADVLPDRIIITASEPYDEGIFRADGTTTDATESTTSATSVPSLVNRFAPAHLGPANGPGLLWALDLQQASVSVSRSTVTSTRTSTSTSTSTRTSTRPTTSTSTLRSTSTSTLRSTSTSSLRPTSSSTSRSTSTPRPTSTSTSRSTSTSTVRPTTTIRSTSASTRTSTRTSTSTSTSTTTRRLLLPTIARSGLPATGTPTAITAPYIPGPPRFPPGRTPHLPSSSSTLTTRTLPSLLPPARVSPQAGVPDLPLHGVLNNIIGRSYRAQPQDNEENGTDATETSPPRDSNSNSRPSRPEFAQDKPTTDVNTATAITKVELSTTCTHPGVSKLLDIDLDLSGINIDVDLYLDILSSSSSSSGGGGLVSGLLNAILGRRDVKSDLKAKAAQQKEKTEQLKQRLQQDAIEEKEHVIKKTYEAKCGAILAVPSATTFASTSPTSTGQGGPPRRPAKKNNSRPTRPEPPAKEITETVVTIEEVSEVVTVVEECILRYEEASVRASVKVGEVRECLGVTVRRGVEVDNCLYFEEEEVRSDSFVPVRRERRI